MIFRFDDSLYIWGGAGKSVNFVSYHANATTVASPTLPYRSGTQVKMTI